MSLKRIIVLGLLCILAFSSCEDKQSKKNKSNSNASSETDSKKMSDSTIATQRSKPNTIENEVDSLEKEKFKLTNENMREFLNKYGEENPETVVRIKTSFGDIDIQLYKETPLHRANFIYLVKQGYFDETFFYRVAKNFVIQGGNSDRDAMARKRFEIGKSYTIPQEQIKGLSHTRGAVALSKQWVDNPSNRSTPFEFFIVVANKGAHHLDGEHTIFGKVIRGMSIADKISNVPVDGSEWPMENIFIKAKVLK